MSADEILALSIEKLGDDSRMYETFAGDREGGEAFIKSAEEYGLDDEAAIVEKFFE